MKRAIARFLVQYEHFKRKLHNFENTFLFLHETLMRIGLFHDPEKDTPKVQSL